MSRSLCSMGLLFIAFAMTSLAATDVEASGQYSDKGDQLYSNYDYQQRQYLFLQSGVSNGKQWGNGPIAIRVAYLEDAICPSRVCGYLTKTRCGPFTTIR